MRIHNTALADYDNTEEIIDFLKARAIQEIMGLISEGRGWDGDYMMDKIIKVIDEMEATIYRVDPDHIFEALDIRPKV